MFRKMYQGGSLRKQGPRPAICEPENELPREAQVRPCEWPSEDFMVQVGIKEEFEAYVRNVDFESFKSYKCCQLITHKYRGSQQFSRVEYSTQIY